MYYLIVYTLIFWEFGTICWSFAENSILFLGLSVTCLRQQLAVGSDWTTVRLKGNTYGISNNLHHRFHTHGVLVNRITIMADVILRIVFPWTAMVNGRMLYVGLSIRLSVKSIQLTTVCRSKTFSCLLEPPPHGS